MRHSRLNRIATDPIERLRRLRGELAPEPSETQAAVRRMMKTPDMRTLIDWMVSQSYGRTIASDAPDSALRENEARKRFLDQILALAEEPVESSQAPPGAKPRT